MRFSDIIGQEPQKAYLRRMVRAGRIPHAQLFTGRPGSGGLPLALAFAQYVACPNRTEEDSCGVCPACLQYANLQHPDLHFIFPIAKAGLITTQADALSDWREILRTWGYIDLHDWVAYSGGENKQYILYDSQAEDILHALSLKSYADGFRTVIVWLPERMNVTGANKMLKMIEEPPAQTMFILVSEEPNKLLTTTRSRTQELFLPPLPDDDIKAALLSRYDLSPEQAQSIAHLSEGDWHTAWHTVQREEWEDDLLRKYEERHSDSKRMGVPEDCKMDPLRDFKALMRNAWLVGHKKQYGALLDLRRWCNEISSPRVGRERQKHFLQYMQRQIRENFIANYGQPAMRFQTAEERAFSERFAQFIGADTARRMMEELDRAESQLSQNGNAKIIFFDLCLQFVVFLK